MPALVYILLSIALALLAPWRAEPIAGYKAGPETLRCQPPSLPARTFVGFLGGEPALGDYEPAAREATRILRATQEQSCALGELQDAGRRLHTALGTAPLEIAEVLFKNAELNAAEVHLQTSGADGAGGRPRAQSWTLRFVCNDENAWHVVSSAQR